MTGNAVVDQLPLVARRDFLREAKPIALEAEQEILTAGAEIEQLYFPTTAVCSMLIALRSGQRAEVATVGNEGFVGVPLVLARRPSPEYVVVQVSGNAYMLRAERLRRLEKKYSALCNAMLEYIAYAVQVAKQSIVCNAYHAIDQRLARWLLTAHDRARSDEFRMTQELLANMVAATRPRVNEAAGRLRIAGIIDYERSVLKIKDRRRLEAYACECYAITGAPFRM